MGAKAQASRAERFGHFSHHIWLALPIGTVWLLLRTQPEPRFKLMKTQATLIF
jgi:hypothetical protein